MTKKRCVWVCGCVGDHRGMAPGLPGDDIEALRRSHIAARAAPIYPDHRKMLRETRPDLVIISTRLDRIAPLAIDAAGAGCHLICEKPLAIKHDTLIRLWEAVTAGGVQCFAMLTNSSHPALMAARHLVEHGRIGDVVLANARKSYKWGERPDWFGRRELYGGTIGWIGIHGLDFIRFASGLEFTSVSAMQSNLAHPERPDCEDNCVLALGLSNGGHATVSVDFLRPNAAPTHGDDWIRVVGTRGVIEAHMARNSCTLVTEDESLHEVPLPESPGFLRPLLAALPARGAAPVPDTLRAFLLTHVCLCARDAADRREVVEIPAGRW